MIMKLPNQMQAFGPINVRVGEKPEPASVALKLPYEVDGKGATREEYEAALKRPVHPLDLYYEAQEAATPQPTPPAQEQRELVPGDLVMWLGSITKIWKPREVVKILENSGLRLKGKPIAHTFECERDEWRLPTADELKNAAAQERAK